MPIAEGFRVFTDPTVFKSRPGHRLARGIEVQDEAVTVYTDGSCIHNGDEDARAGSGVWFGNDDPRNIAVRVPGPHQTNQTGEIYAVNRAAAVVPPFAPLHIISDSKYVIEGLTAHLHNWTDKGWIGVANAEHFRAAAYQLRKRSAVTTFEWTKGHEGTEGNEGADALAGVGARKPINTETTLNIPNEWNLTGAKLSTLTQALAYKGIRERQQYRQRAAAEAPLDMARNCVHDHLGGRKPTDATIWHGLRNKDISRNISDFLWRATHKSQRVGKYWDHIPGFETRATCPLCDEEESMEHILVDCDSPERKIIWRLAEKAWAKKHNEWPGVHIGNIIGAPLAQFKNEKGERKGGASRFFTILMTESAHLIWKIRCERRIQRTEDEGRTHTDEEITRRWHAALNTRLRLDCEMSHAKYETRRISPDKVQRTWAGLLKNERDLPPHWTRMGFLVGMDPL
ncbi:ribonuclease H-like protein [Irpex lacteus]|nr:ribonuclease H-like protein [Irpex lacteus]